MSKGIKLILYVVSLISFELVSHLKWCKLYTFEFAIYFVNVEGTHKMMNGDFIYDN